VLPNGKQTEAFLGVFEVVDKHGEKVRSEARANISTLAELMDLVSDLNPDLQETTQKSIFKGVDRIYKDVATDYNVLIDDEGNIMPKKGQTLEEPQRRKINSVLQRKVKIFLNNTGDLSEGDIADAYTKSREFDVDVDVEKDSGPPADLRIRPTGVPSHAEPRGDLVAGKWEVIWVVSDTEAYDSNGNLLGQK
jgi:hypothetical protein